VRVTKKVYLAYTSIWSYVTDSHYKSCVVLVALSRGVCCAQN